MLLLRTAEPWGCPFCLPFRLPLVHGNDLPVGDDGPCALHALGVGEVEGQDLVVEVNYT